jgi:precorrin-3B methylase
MMSKKSNDYPSREMMASRWESLAKKLSDESESFVKGDTSDKKGGELFILGSGLSAIDFTRDAEQKIRNADYVFYCVCDPITQVWINQIRPDAYDLFVLYSENRPRYRTYVQMAEAMLYYVRKGKKVVSIYYGHPGIFAAPTHRALQIARNLGLKAVMRPGVSALDYLAAEVGFDPAYPGMLSYEASDMLLRDRKIDTTLHLILWQAGIVGEFGYNPAGYSNGGSGFGVLVDVLEKAYGANWTVCHYVAARYAGVEPTIERFTIADLRRPEVRKQICPLSTFYVEPKDPVKTNKERSVALDATKPGKPVGRAARTRNPAGYGKNQLNALKALKDFSLPANYRIPKPTAGTNFMIALGEDAALLAQYQADPEKAVNDKRFSALTPTAKKLLAIPHVRAIEAGIVEDP